MARSRSGPRPTAIDAQLYRPDLLAKRMNIRSASATRKVYASALIENVGVARVSGPFKIAMYVDLYRGGVTTSYVQVFTVPASVSLAGRPVFVQALARGLVDNNTVWQTQYTTEEMQVPLYYRDVDGSYYDGGFLVDSDNQVSESNEYNNYYTWQGSFWFTSPGASRKKGPIVFERPGLS